MSALLGGLVAAELGHGSGWHVCAVPNRGEVSGLVRLERLAIELEVTAVNGSNRKRPRTLSGEAGCTGNSFLVSQGSGFIGRE